MDATSRQGAATSVDGQGVSVTVGKAVIQNF
jgi:hypothetical protein